jgi:hypothetical protein
LQGKEIRAPSCYKREWPGRARADLSHVTKAGTQPDTTERRLACFSRRLRRLPNGDLKLDTTVRKCQWTFGENFSI